MTIVEIIGMQQIRIHTLEDQVRRLGAANTQLSKDLFEVAPEKFPNGDPSRQAGDLTIPAAVQPTADESAAMTQPHKTETLPAGDAV